MLVSVEPEISQNFDIKRSLKDYKSDVSKHLKTEMMRFCSKLDIKMRYLHVYMVCKFFLFLVKILGSFQALKHRCLWLNYKHKVSPFGLQLLFQKVGEYLSRSAVISLEAL